MWSKRPRIGRCIQLDLEKHSGARKDLSELKTFWTLEVNHHRAGPPISVQTFEKTRERLLSELYCAYFYM